VIHRELGEHDQARKILERLRLESPTLHGDLSYLAEIDVVLLDVEQLTSEARWPRHRSAGAGSTAGDPPAG